MVTEEHGGIITGQPIIIGLLLAGITALIVGKTIGPRWTLIVWAGGIMTYPTVLLLWWGDLGV